MNNDIETAILVLAEAPGDATYIRRRDVRLYLVTAGNKSAWVALRNGVRGFEVSDYFADDSTADVSAWHREQAFALAREGTQLDLAEARQRFLGRRHLDGPDPSRKRRSKAA